MKRHKVIELCAHPEIDGKIHLQMTPGAVYSGHDTLAQCWLNAG